MLSVNILGVNVRCANVDSLLERVREWSFLPERRVISYVNAHCLNIASADHEYRDILNVTDLVYSDGVGAVWAGLLLSRCRLEKITGRDWILDFERMASANRLRIYILAGKPGIAQLAAEAMQRRSPDMVVVGASDGFFVDKSETEVLQEIAAASPHVVFVGMGTPVQEKWIAQNRHAINAPVCWAVGALFDYVAGIEPPAPAWINDLALEWFWRFCMDPLGKWRRYLVGTPVFILRVLRQKIGMK